MDVAIVGAGAVGLGLASCLADREGAIHLVARREDAARAIRTSGIVRSGLFGAARVDPAKLHVATDVGALAGATIETILVCTKTLESETVARALADVWDSFATPPRVVLCHNGWGSAEVFAAQLPRSAVFSARVITGFRRTSEHAVEITVHAQPIHVGGLFGQDAADVAPLCAEIARGGIPCEAVDSIERDLLAKLLYNCLLNPLGALVRVPYGELGKRPETRAIMATIAHEVFAVLDAAGRRTHWATADEYLDTFHAQLLPPTASHESSMLQDLRAGRRTEIDALSGAVVAMGKEAGVEAPVNAALLALIHAAEEAASQEIAAATGREEG